MKGWRGLWAAVVVPFLLVGIWQVQANAGPSAQTSASQTSASAAEPVSIASTAEQRRANRSYWTEERMRKATPREPIRRPVPGDRLAEPGPAEAPKGPPGFSPGSRGGASAQQQAAVTSDDEIAAPQHGTKPSNPKDGPYGPFQRFSLVGKYVNYPARTIGRLFFTLNGSNFSCSASTIEDNKIMTAGHCVSDGGSATWATNFTFCPAWRPFGPNPAFGCWDNWTGAATSAPWFFNGDLDYDYGVVTFGPDGTKGLLPGQHVGWMGYGWNWGTNQPDMAFGYPAGAPFNGHVLIQVASTDWYTQDWTSGGQVSKVMGNDMTGGSSGGPWVLGWRHPSAEVADTDGSNATDPAGPFVNGINSNKRCRNSCFTPPTSTSGTFWQEMISPPFENTSDNNDVTDVIAAIP